MTVEFDYRAVADHRQVYIGNLEQEFTRACEKIVEAEARAHAAEAALGAARAALGALVPTFDPEEGSGGFDDEQGGCLFDCPAQAPWLQNSPSEHAPDCPLTVARAALAATPAARPVTGEAEAVSLRLMEAASDVWAAHAHLEVSLMFRSDACAHTLLNLQRALIDRDKQVAAVDAARPAAVGEIAIVVAARDLLDALDQDDDYTMNSARKANALRAAVAAARKGEGLA